MVKQNIKIALVGNPNSGKTSLFNALTGLHQKVGNFPGVTVDKKVGTTTLSPGSAATIIDLPGTYSLYPRRIDEWVAYKVLMNTDKKTIPGMILLVLDASNLKRNLLFCSQLIDLKIPIIVALSMMDIAAKKGIQIDVEGLEKDLGIPVIPVNPRKGKGIAELKKKIEQIAFQKENFFAPPDFIENKKLAVASVGGIQELLPDLSDYASIHYLINHENFPLENNLQDAIENVEKSTSFNHTKTQAEEIAQRYARIGRIMSRNVVESNRQQKKILMEKIDNVLLHRVWGYLIMLAVLFLLFQSIFWLARYPMDFIDENFTLLVNWLNAKLPDAWWSNLLVNGLLAGIGGIVVFVPQIMILFGLITILEDTGYMARISFLSDKLMRKVGLNGKSLMPMISGYACAVPAIMASRNIENKKERLLTIMVTPLMSCSARLPVYTILIGITVPDVYFLGIFGARGLVMMAMYLLGTILALIISYVMKWWIKTKEKSFFILELPLYRAPRWKNVGITMIEKAKIFVRDAGKVIIIISMLLWFLSNYGPAKRMENIAQKYTALEKTAPNAAARNELHHQMKTEKLQNSYAGILGQTIEPAIKPLGYDWKIGIALITSFAAREVFVGTMATLYSVESENRQTLQQKMKNATRTDGSPVYTLATAISLMVFYVLAMQCMSTLAVVKRETKSWKLPLIQFCYMGVLAYLCSFLAYTIFS
ncbi:MAG: ferrous iron transport protein B [Chitinophagaceae bacterium]|jgi:ferrous iron transport protein B|nr:ferrous iron transport protein B [Chitinophagaceae bacterium]